MIKTFANKETAAAFQGLPIKRIPADIRVNDQWRISFIWQDGNAYDVEIIDYH